jgi:hypothetical protein
VNSDSLVMECRVYLGNSSLKTGSCLCASFYYDRVTSLAIFTYWIFISQESCNR